MMMMNCLRSGGFSGRRQRRCLRRNLPSAERSNDEAPGRWPRAFPLAVASGLTPPALTTPPRSFRAGAGRLRPPPRHPTNSLIKALIGRPLRPGRKRPGRPPSQSIAQPYVHSGHHPPAAPPVHSELAAEPSASGQAVTARISAVQSPAPVTAQRQRNNRRRALAPTEEGGTRPRSGSGYRPTRRLNRQRSAQPQNLRHRLHRQAGLVTKKSPGYPSVAPPAHAAQSICRKIH